MTGDRLGAVEGLGLTVLLGFCFTFYKLWSIMKLLSQLQAEHMDKLFLLLQGFMACVNWNKISTCVFNSGLQASRTTNVP